MGAGAWTGGGGAARVTDGVGGYNGMSAAEPRPRRDGRVRSAVLSHPVRALASLRLTVVLLAVFFSVLVLDAEGVARLPNLRAAALLALGVNLLAVLVRRRRSLVRKPALLTFHVLLVVLTVLGFLSHLVHFQSYAEVVEGQRVRLLGESVEQGPLAPAALGTLSLSLDAIQSSYWPGGNGKEASATVTLYDGDTSVNVGRVEPNEPLVHGSVRTLLTPVRGFAAVFSFASAGAAPQQGVILFPELRKRPDSQWQKMFVPGLRDPLHCGLIAASVARDDAPWEFVVPDQVSVDIWDGDQPVGSVAVGGTIAVGQGLLHLDSVRRYAGFFVRYDPTEPIMQVVMLLLPATLVWHQLTRRRTRRREARDGD